MEEQFAHMSENERTRMLTKFCRDAKIYRREDLQSEFTSQGDECLFDRMKIGRFCPIPR